MTPEQLAAADPLLAFIAANDAAAPAIGAQLGRRGQRPDRPGGRKGRPGPVRGLRHQPVSGRDLLAAPVLRRRSQGWTYRGVTVPAFTYIGGLYERATGAEPFNAAQALHRRRGRVNKETVYDFTSTNDIIGGNSGSPVINAAGEVIGAAFDGNIHSLGGAYGYDGDAEPHGAACRRRRSPKPCATSIRSPRLLEELGVRVTTVLSPSPAGGGMSARQRRRGGDASARLAPALSSPCPPHPVAARPPSPGGGGRA